VIHMMRMFIAAFAVVAVALGAASVAVGQYYEQPAQPAGAALEKARAQLTTARTHAGFAAAAGTLPGVRQHTGHAVNCLVGTGDRRFDRQWGHVCEGQGNGVLADLRTAGGSAQVTKMVQDATQAGVETLGQSSLAAAQAGAKKLAGMLEDALKALR
jgi:phosphoheptose isomerase